MGESSMLNNNFLCNNTFMIVITSVIRSQTVTCTHDSAPGCSMTLKIRTLKINLIPLPPMCQQGPLREIRITLGKNSFHNHCSVQCVKL
jgi:hypothetical protein